jgi:hypothetical protein
MTKKAWNGRFEKDMDRLADEYSESMSDLPNTTFVAA